jgi:hypothetical protein
MRSRPIYRPYDAAIRGHVFCFSFLAVTPLKWLDTRCGNAGFRPEWPDVLRDPDRLQTVELARGSQQITLCQVMKHP